MVASISFSGTECRHEIFAFPARTEFSVTTAQCAILFQASANGEKSPEFWAVDLGRLVIPNHL
jgi:hypothetical protein